MTTRLYAGIDPGLGGAIGIVNADGTFAAVFDMPTLPTTTGRRQVDFAALAAILSEHQPTFTLVERVGPRPHEGAVGAFGFGMTYGGILSMLATMRLSHDVVQPATWKRLLPDAAPFLTRIKDDGRAEALLLALQARSSFTPHHHHEGNAK